MTTKEDDKWDVRQSKAFKSKTPAEIEALYSTELPPDRETNPAQWDSLITFFTSLLIELSTNPGHLLLPSPTISRTLLKLITPPPQTPPFHLTPILHQVLSQTSLFIPADSIQLPLPPPQSLFSRLLRQLFGNSRWGDKVNVYVVEDVVKRRVGMLGEVVKDNGFGGSLGIVGMRSVVERVCGGDMKEGEVVLGYGGLMGMGDGELVEYWDGRKQRWGWKVGKKEEGDGEVLELLEVLKEGEGMVDELGRRWTDLGVKAVKAKERGDRRSCVGFLKRRKEVEKRRKNAEGVVDKIGAVLMAIEDGRRMKGVVDVIGKGVKVAKEQSVLVERVEEVMGEFDELREDVEEVNKIWETAAAAPLADISDEALLEELEELDGKEVEKEEEIVAPVKPMTPMQEAKPLKAVDVQMNPEEKEQSKEQKMLTIKMMAAVEPVKRTVAHSDEYASIEKENVPLVMNEQSRSGGITINAPAETTSESSVEDAKETRAEQDNLEANSSEPTDSLRTDQKPTNNGPTLEDTSHLVEAMGNLAIDPARSKLKAETVSVTDGEMKKSEDLFDESKERLRNAEEKAESRRDIRQAVPL